LNTGAAFSREFQAYEMRPWHALGLSPIVSSAGYFKGGHVRALCLAETRESLAIATLIRAATSGGCV